MKIFGILLTKNYKAIKFLRFNTNEEAEGAYQDYKKQGCGVVKVNIEKAHEIYITNIPAL